MHELEIEDHFAFRCLVYCEIQGRHSIAHTLVNERHRDELIYPQRRVNAASIELNQSMITDFFPDDLSKGQRETKRRRDLECTN